ncbi:MAG TPA: hypothetical protein DD417_11790 [Elusimicrobia bacterium]|nr:hypothetical protein [Elusimicrobiota bacterium]
MAVTQRVDFKSLADTYFEWVRRECAGMPSRPAIATIHLRGEGAHGSAQYRDLILKDAERLGIRFRSVEAEDEAGILEAIRSLNAAPDVQGIVVLYPLGLSRRDEDVMDLVSPAKDIEGLHSVNLGHLIKYRRFLDEKAGWKCVVPATAKAVVKTLTRYAPQRIPGAFVTIVNNSMRVGKPIGLMLENMGATVVKCYDGTRREVLEDCVRRADIVITAVPDPAFRLDPSWVREGAVVIDVSFQGNVDAASLEDRAALVSGPGNRVGRMTRAMIFVNLVYCCRPIPVYPLERGLPAGKSL